MRNRKKLVLALSWLLVAAVLLSGCGRRRTSAEKRVSNRRGGRHDETVATVPQNETVPRDTEEIEITEPTDFTEALDETEATQSGPLIYDARKPDYIPSNPIWETKHFEWESQTGDRLWMDIPLNREMYEYYRALERYYDPSEYYVYVNDKDNQRLIKEVVECLRRTTENLSYDDTDVAREIAKFVQDVIDYQYDSISMGMEEYPRYPIETLYEGIGDCEDTSILMAGLLKEWGYEVGFLHLPGHFAVAIRTADDYESGSYYEFNGHRYLYIESTGSGWHIGQIPEELLDNQAKLYLIP